MMAFSKQWRAVVIVAVVLAVLLACVVLLAEHHVAAPPRSCVHRWYAVVTVGTATPVAIEHDDPVPCPSGTVRPLLEK